MRVRQRASLRVSSNLLDPGQISALVGVDPHETKLRGSRSPGPPPLPRFHLWHFNSGLADDLRLDEHLGRLVGTVSAHADGFREVASTPETNVWLSVVRYFEEGPEDFDEATYGLPADSPFERLSGQHPFLGWGLDTEQLALLGQTGIGLDVDEYG